MVGQRVIGRLDVRPWNEHKIPVYRGTQTDRYKYMATKKRLRSSYTEIHTKHVILTRQFLERSHKFGKSQICLHSHMKS